MKKMVGLSDSTGTVTSMEKTGPVPSLSGVIEKERGAGRSSVACGVVSFRINMKHVLE